MFSAEGLAQTLQFDFIARDRFTTKFHNHRRWPMFRIAAFFASGIVSFLLVSTVVAQQLASTSLEVKPAADGRLKMAAVRHLTGTVKDVDLTNHTFTIKNRRGEQSFVISPETQLKKGREHLRLDGLQPESEVTVSYWDRNGKKEAGVIQLAK
jgi:hypothetical protein